jgi:transglutaminase-like putative cysteine protease
VSVFCPVLGWLDLDATNDVIPRQNHVTVAIGRDYGDVAPLRGVIRGGSEHELAVAVRVARSPGPDQCGGDSGPGTPGG